MSKTEQEILRLLTELESAAKTVKTADSGSGFQTLFTRIDELAAQLPRNAASELVHYLQRKSYDKARLWLEGRRKEVAQGGCGK